MGKVGQKLKQMRILIDSEVCKGLRYEVIDRHIVQRGGPNGLFSMSLDVGEAVGLEIAEVCKTWKDVRT